MCSTTTAPPSATSTSSLMNSRKRLTGGVSSSTDGGSRKWSTALISSNDTGGDVLTYGKKAKTMEQVPIFVTQNQINGVESIGLTLSLVFDSDCHVCA